MTMAESLPATIHDPQRPSEGRAAFVALTLLVLVALLLATIRIFDWSVFVADGIPRAELCGAFFAVLVYLPLARLSRIERGGLLRFFVLLLPILAAAAFLAWEATTLVLCPSTFEFVDAHLPIARSEVLVIGAATIAAELVAGGIALAVALSFLLAFATEAHPENRHRLLRSLVTSAVVGALLLVLVPMTGPGLGLLPMPASAANAAAATAVAVPRTGFVCLPAVVALTLIGHGVRRLRHGQSPSVACYVSLGLAVVVTLIELLSGRYSVVGIAVAAALVAGVQIVHDLGNDMHARSEHAKVEARGSTALSRARALLTVVFFFSGMAALVYQVVFAKGLALTFGSTSHASTIVLATYMGGLAIGSWVGGRWGARLRRPVVGYALAELGIAAICALAPWTLRLARWAYVALAQGSDPSEPWLVALQLGLGALVLVPPTWLMGLTLPLLTRQFLDERTGLGGSAGLLYTANTLGAAVGASVTGYFVLPTLGIGKSLFLAVATNVIVACFALLAAQVARRDARTKETQTPDEGRDDRQSTAATTAPELADATARQVAWIATIQLTIGGFVTFGLETTFIHLLATVAGTSAYAFSLMLFAFLIGLSYGSSLGRKWLPSRSHLPQALLLCQLVLAVTLLLACRFWDYLPAYFALFGRWPYTLTFASREFVRFVVCLAVMLPPAICIGAQFPIAMEAVGIGWPRDKIQALGRASALNTVGNIVGALVVGFVALPRLGSHRTLGMLTLMCVLLSALALWAIERQRRPRWMTAVAACAVALFVQPPQFDLTRLCSGGNVYFKPQYYGRVIDHAESLDGGLTAVALSFEDTPNPVKTLLTNGKFQGNDRRDSSGEMVAQSSFAIAPLLHTAERNSALVIGFGTGTTTRVLDEAGFRSVSVAELSADIVNLADRHFATINHGVIHQPNVHVHVTDGRNFLLLDRHRYDLISIELSSIWFAGAANLYNDEFYALVEPRLADGGILQQWVQLHRLSHRDVMSILVTLRQRFPRVWLYFLGKQGVLIACKSDCQPSSDTVRQLEQAPRLKATLALFNDGLNGVLRGRMLTPDGLDRLIADYREETKSPIAKLVSTDDNLYLEYSTPKGNVREYDESIADNEAFLGRYRAAGPFEATQLQLNAQN